MNAAENKKTRLTKDDYAMLLLMTEFYARHIERNFEGLTMVLKHADELGRYFYDKVDEWDRPAQCRYDKI